MAVSCRFLDKDVEAKSVVGVVLEAPEPVREEALCRIRQFGTVLMCQGSLSLAELDPGFLQAASNE